MVKNTSDPGCWVAIHSSPELMLEVIDCIAHPVFVKDRELRFVLVNQALTELVGRRKSEMLGKTDFEIFSEREAQFFRQADEKVFTTDEPVVIEEEAVADVNGNVHLLTTTKIALRNDRGEVSWIVGASHDITSLKRAEDTLRLTKEDLETRVAERTTELRQAQQEILRKERLALLGQLAGGLAHQLRNPLASITNAASVLEHRLAPGTQADAVIALSIIKEEVIAANQIITDLMDYANMRPARTAPAMLTEIVDSALEAQVIPTGVEVDRDIPEDLEAQVDPQQLRNALRNLVRNSFEAMPNGGRVHIVARSDAGRLKITVTDNGLGIPGEMRAHLFDPLVSTKQLGLGLGLTTARALVENQRGTLTCTDRDGGARFEIELPLSLDASED